MLLVALDLSQRKVICYNEKEYFFLIAVPASLSPPWLLINLTSLHFLLFFFNKAAHLSDGLVHNVLREFLLWVLFF